jgi:hypothetical protein
MNNGPQGGENTNRHTLKYMAKPNASELEARSARSTLERKPHRMFLATDDETRWTLSKISTTVAEGDDLSSESRDTMTTDNSSDRSRRINSSTSITKIPFLASIDENEQLTTFHIESMSTRSGSSSDSLVSNRPFVPRYGMIDQPALAKQESSLYLQAIGAVEETPGDLLDDSVTKTGPFARFSSNCFDPHEIECGSWTRNRWHCSCDIDIPNSLHCKLHNLSETETRLHKSAPRATTMSSIFTPETWRLRRTTAPADVERTRGESI